VRSASVPSRRSFTMSIASGMSSFVVACFFFSRRRRHTRFKCDWSSDVCSSDLDAHPYRKARFGEWYFTWTAVGTFNRRYLVRPPRVRLEAGETSIEGVTVVVQNSNPYSYFGRRPLLICEGSDPINGRLSAAVLKRATPLEMFTLIPRILSGRPGSVARHRQIESVPGLRQLRV